MDWIESYQKYQTWKLWNIGLNVCFCAITELSPLDNKFLHFISKNSLQPCIWRQNIMMPWSKLPRVDSQDFIIISKICPKDANVLLSWFCFYPIHQKMGRLESPKLRNLNGREFLKQKVCMESKSGLVLSKRPIHT